MPGKTPLSDHNESASTETARSETLGKIRERLNVRGDEIARRGLVQARLRAPKVNLIPERAQKPKAERVHIFQTMLELAGAKVRRSRSWKGLGEAIATELREANLPMQLRVGEDAAFSSLRAEPGVLEIASGPAEASDCVGLSHAMGAAAETGTLFLLSGPDNPSTLNFLPETHIIAIGSDDIAGAYEEVWAKIRETTDGKTWPRTINLISGPSRTADVEQTIVMGAHGPRRLIVFIVG